MTGPIVPPFPYKDARGVNFLFCIVCMAERREFPNQASFINQGDSICYEHSPSAPKRVVLPLNGI